MSYQVLARKWRPHTFEEMVGQASTLRILTNALEQSRLHHAYLFTGTRGVGKTTLGRILAKCLNCESGITASPCGTCYACQAIDQGQFLDLYEVDAASRTKVEDTRELLENVLYPPSKGRFKIYLIDEVHMLSNHSFNALLKTLEEPPEHVKFILATTDPKKLPATVLSRCLQFNLKRIHPQKIADHMEHICLAEKIPYEKNALEKIAEAADGSLRDALSLLDQAIAYGQGELKSSEMTAMLGAMNQDDIWPILNALSISDHTQIFHTLSEISESSSDFTQLLETLISGLHEIAMAQCFGQLTAQTEKVASLAKQISPEDAQLYYQIALLGRRDLSLAVSPQQGFEMTIMRMMTLKPPLHVDAPLSHQPITIPATIEKKIDSKIAQPPLTNRQQPITAASEWHQILPQLKLTGMAQALASNCILSKIEDHLITLSLSATHQPMLNAKLKERLIEALSEYFKKPIQLHIEITSDPLDTPHQQQQLAHAEQLENAKKAATAHPQIKKLIEMYDATVEVSLLGDG